MLHLRQKISLAITSSLVLGLTFFLSACFEKDTPVGNDSSALLNNQNSEFPLSEYQEAKYLSDRYGIDCDEDKLLCVEQIDESLAKAFSFKKGQLILRGPNLVSNLNSAWLINSSIQIFADQNVKDIMSLEKESEYHAYFTEADKIQTLVPGLNSDLEAPVEPKLIFQRRLGLPALTYNDEGFCNLLEAEEFIANSNSAWLPHGFNLIPYTTDAGLDEENKTYTAETMVLCGGINLHNRNLTLEAKNIIFYNTHITVSANKEVAAGIKINAENIGYFGHNTIISNITDIDSDIKMPTAPTVDISVQNGFDLVDSNVPTNNPFNSHTFNIYMNGSTPITEDNLNEEPTTKENEPAIKVEEPISATEEAMVENEEIITKESESITAKKEEQ